MNWVHATILGLVEGLTEFLPVSSTGHLILTARLLGLTQNEFMKSFEIAIQLGAVLAVLFVYWRSFLLDWQTLKRVLTAFLPTAVVGFLLYKLIKRFLFESASVVLWGLAAGGVVLILVDLWDRKKEKNTGAVRDIPLAKAFGIGLAQSLAVVPGVSRAGATIVGGLLFGLDKRTSVEFSFLLAVPTIAAATALDLLRSAPAFTTAQRDFLLLGGFISFAVAVGSIRFFLRFVQNRILSVFGVYRIAVAALFAGFVK